MRSDWPFFGRTDESTAVAATLAGSTVGGVVLAGDPGVGRTRLARELVRQHTEAGRHVDWVSALLAPDSIPFGAVAHLLPPHTLDPAHVLHPAAVLRAAAGHYARLGGRAGVVIAVDDAHRLDPYSAALVAHLAAHGHVFALLTVRRGEPVPDAIGALWKDGTVLRIDVSPLPPDTVDELLDHAVPGPVDGISRRRLHAAAHGRPGLLRELLTCAEDWDHRYGVWRFRPQTPDARSRCAMVEVADRLSGRTAPAAGHPLAEDAGRAWTRLWTGDLAGAAAIAEAGYAAARCGEAPLPLGVWALLRGAVAGAAGTVVTAQQWLREAACLLDGGDPRLTSLCFSELARAVAVAGYPSGDPGGANGWLARDHAPEQPWHDRAAAWVLAARGSTTDAVARLLAAARKDPVIEAHLLYDAARLGAAAQVRDRLAELGQAAGDRLVPVLTAAAAGLARGARADRRTADGLAAAASALADLGYLLLAAEASLAAARAYRRLGHRARAEVSRAVAAGLAERCEGARTLLLTFDDVDVALTPREREIVLLAANQTSKTIAARLGIAVSTVNNHLSSAYAKLGIGGREDLAELLRLGNGDSR
jgi:DNA-binding CsgD family transcriptional regulator